jgi:hypothetical protein
MSYGTDGSVTEAMTQLGFWQPSWETTMATTKQKLWKLQLLIEFPDTFLNILNIAECRKAKIST